MYYNYALTHVIPCILYISLPAVLLHLLMDWLIIHCFTLSLEQCGFRVWLCEYYPALS